MINILIILVRAGAARTKIIKIFIRQNLRLLPSYSEVYRRSPH